MQPSALATYPEIITLSGAQIYLSRISRHPPDRYFQHILLGWMTFMAPLTPSSVGDMPHLSYNQGGDRPLDFIPRATNELLWEVAKMGDVASKLIEGKSFSLLSKAWPTMWIWIQHLYHAHQDYLQTFNGRMGSAVKVFFAERYLLFISVLKILVVGYHDDRHKSMVSKILANHPGIFRMMADMWKREATDKHIATGFEAGAFANPRLSIHQGLLVQIVSACGSVEEFVHAACQRVELNLGQARPLYDFLSEELAHLIVHMTQEGDLCRPAIYGSSRVVATLMQAWTHATSSSFTSSIELRDQIIDTCVAGIHFLIMSPKAYDRIVDSLDHGFIPLLLNSIPLVRPSSQKYTEFTNFAVSALNGTICHATSHRNILFSMGRCVSASRRRGKFLQRTSNPRVFDSWSRMLKLLDERENGYKSYKDSSRSVLMCANVECGSDNRGGLRRCPACRISLYCSKKCQRVHWIAHKTLCNIMKAKVQNCVDLSYPNLHYLSHLVAFDTEAQYLAYIASVKTCGVLPGSVPFFFLDYVKLSEGASSIEVLDADVKKPWFPFSDDDNLYQEWRQLMAVPKEQLPRLLVAVPRGPQKNDAQMMTAAMALTNSGAGQMSTIGTRWLHCQ